MSDFKKAMKPYDENMVKDFKFTIPEIHNQKRAEEIIHQFSIEKVMAYSSYFQTLGADAETTMRWLTRLCKLPFDGEFCSMEDEVDAFVHMLLRYSAEGVDAMDDETFERMMSMTIMGGADNLADTMMIEANKKEDQRKTDGLFTLPVDMQCPHCKTISLALYKAERVTQMVDEEPILSYKPLPTVYFGKARDGLCAECGKALKRVDAPSYEEWLDTLPFEDPFNPSYVQS